MYWRATRAELWLFAVVLVFMTGAPSALYVKIFAMAPPAPGAVLVLPCLVLMLGNLILRVRATLTGMVACWAWLGFALLGTASVLWSLSPADTIREGVIAVITVLYLGMVAGIADWDDLLDRAWRVCMLLIGLTLCLYLFIPSLGKMAEIYPGAMSGPWFEKNKTGQFFLWAGLINYALLALRPQRLVKAVIWTLVCGVCLILTESTTALIAFIAVTAMIGLVMLLRRSFVISIPALLCLVFAGLPIGILIMMESASILETLGKSGTLTGRTPVWEALVDFSLNDRPWLGHGYAAFWSSEYEFTSRALVYETVKYRVPHSHNTLLEARLDLGWTGAALLLLAGAQLVLVSLWRMRQSSGAYFALPFIVALTLVSLVEVSPMAVNNMAGFLFVLTLAKMTLNPSQTDRLSGAWRMMDRLGRRAQTHAPAYPVRHAAVTY